MAAEVKEAVLVGANVAEAAREVEWAATMVAKVVGTAVAVMEGRSGG